MDNKTIKAIKQIRANKDVPDTVTDGEIIKLIELGDTLRAGMSPNIENLYSEMQQWAITCSTAYEIANDAELDNFDIEKFDREFDEEFFGKVEDSEQ